MQSRNYKGTILVSGASGIVGYGILRSLSGLGYKLIGTTIYDESPANCFSDFVEIPPLTSDINYLPWLLNIISKYNVDMIIPGIEADMSLWNKNREQIIKAGAVAQLNNQQLVETCLDKWMFYLQLKKYAPQFAIRTSINKDISDFKFPIILKPRCGFGSKGLIKVESKSEFNIHIDRIGSELIVQEYVGTDDEEYTVSGFFDEHSHLCAYIPMKRKLSKLGFTEIAETTDIPEFFCILQFLGNSFQAVGPTNFQFRRHNDGWKLLEINPRISSSTSIRTKFGYNECRMCVDYFLERKKVFQPRLITGKAFRYTEDYVIV